MAEDGIVSFKFKEAKDGGRTPVEDSRDFEMSTVYDATFDPWQDDGRGSEGTEIEPTEPFDPGFEMPVDAFDFML